MKVGVKKLYEPYFKRHTMKLFKLIVHHKSFSGEDLIINPKDFPGIKQGSVVEIYLPEDEFSRLLLQVTSFKEDMQSKDTISVEQSIATAFQLRTYADVYVNIVNPADVALDSVELTFKDQYLGRSEMWRLKNSLVDTCVYVNKKIEFCGGTIRCQVYEMWSMGDRVACGVITNDTKVVFRSSTSMVYLFIQMSSEMWDFDIHGDLYFEKAVNGFLADLFQKWKKNGSNHEVTIVLFSRTFYRATTLEEFPTYMKECLQQDYKGRFYEDFYRVAVQNERYEDWTNTLVQLRRLFTDYQKIVLEYHKRPGEHVPKAVNSTAAQGNFLEVLNMSLNVFEKHYLDRSFDRTGQLSVVITPGVGVFEVDRELTNVTKQRIIDNGVGSDLVCVGEQPLHAVPLLKFHNKDTLFSAGDDYSMPHWINLSFYSTNKKVAYSNFIPRIKLPPKRSKPLPVSNNGLIQAAKSKLLQEDDCMPNSLFDYDAYDAQVFQLPPVHTARFSRSLQRMNSRTRRSGTLDTQSSSGQKTVSRKMSDPDIHHSGGDIGSPTGSSAPRSAAISIPYHHSSHASPQQSSGNAESLKQKAFAIQSEIQEVETSPPVRPVVGSAGSPSNMPQGQVNFPRTGRALINPFDPSHVTIKLTSNRRRWTHIFPKGPTGVLIQQHHYQAVPTMPASDQPIFDGTATLSSSPQNENSTSSGVSRTLRRSSSQVAFQENVKIPGSVRPNLLSSGTSERRMPANKSLILLWGATGEQEWTPALTTGVDWKSLTIPACLPITTDYFPDKRSLQNDYVVSDYTLLPDDVNADFAQQRAIYRKPLTTPEVFRELVSQRLAQGFQLIVLNNQVTSKKVQTPGNNTTPVSTGISSVVMTRTTDTVKTEEHFLSIGRMFHKISLSGSAITVTRYRPRHPYHPFKVHYRYRFHAPHHDTYEISWVSFTTEKLETYNWNYLDHYICTRGDVDFALVDALKYWRFRVYLLPLNHQATKKILDGAENCDIYAPLSIEEQGHLAEGFLRFIETWVNKVKRPNTHKKPRSPVSAGNKAHHRLILRRHSASTIFLSHNNTSSSNLVTASGLQSTNLQTSVVGNSPFRERLGSNRVLEKPRPRSGSKVMERIKAEGINPSGRISPASEAAANENKNVFPQTFPFETSIESQDNPDDSTSQTDLHRLKSNASIQEILDAMKNVQTGVGFLTNHPSLPSNTFVSADAVQWLIAHVEGISHEEKAVNLLTNMLNEKLICHASGDFRHPIIVGFYLYHIVQLEKDMKDGEYVRPIGDLPSFENEWLEVEVKHPAGWQQEQLTSPVSETSSSSTAPKFLLDELDKCCHYHGENNNSWSVPLYKHTHLETDVNNKSDRIEWGHARYQSVFRPNRAYELVVQWVASSGTVVAELIQGWSRKAPTCGFQMVPIPADTISLPFTDKSDPLRGPIFITLDTECLLGGRNFLFEEYPVDTWKQRLFLFQESIIERFGFIHCTIEGHNNNSLPGDSGGVSHHNIYVHVTGNVFILIPSQHCQHTHREGEPVLQTSNRASSGGKQQLNHEGKRYPVHSENASSPHESYITRHVSEKYNKDIGNDLRVGFLWSWNHMVSRRWKSSSTPATGDETFQTKLLRDFRDFCANRNNRLQNYWNSCWLLPK